MVEIQAIDKANIEAVWPFVAGYVQACLETQKPRLVDHDFLRDKCTAGEHNLLVAIDDEMVIGCGVIYEENLPLARVCGVYLIGGTQGDKWIDKMVEVIEEIASLNQCKFVITMGRKGWARRLPDYETGHSDFYKELA